MITVSLCMIVKNEETVLARCLDSLDGLMDEIIIVDTGSIDRTKEIAGKYTNQVYDYEWNNDFSQARNYTLSLAHCDYIYCADADEVMDEENREKFRQLKQVLLPEIEIVQMLYSGQYDSNTVYNFDEEYRPKLFRRLRSFQFINPIHETLRLDPVVYDSDIRIFHKPHGLHTDRDMEIFETHYSPENAPLIPFELQRMYAKELFISGKDEHFLHAIPVFLRILAKDECSSDELLYASCVLARAYRLTGDTASFFKYAMKATLSESCSEICMELGHFYEERNDLEEAHIWYYNAAFETTPICNIHSGGDEALLALARVLENSGLYEQARIYRKQAQISINS
ncbi:MAG: glycosyltransferase family 2 protein [Lachnospiraceae bacterium]|nr:glycosyltransferase family 2 protein [Lachnospiraceae bacterium]